jgi:hypothetical protein
MNFQAGKQLDYLIKPRVFKPDFFQELESPQKKWAFDTGTTIAYY